MTREEADELVSSISKKTADNEPLSSYERVIWGQVKLAEREHREVLVEDIEEIKFWME